MVNLLRPVIRHYRQIAVLGALVFASALCIALLVVRLAYTRNYY